MGCGELSIMSISNKHFILSIFPKIWPMTPIKRRKNIVKRKIVIEWWITSVHFINKRHKNGKFIWDSYRTLTFSLSMLCKWQSWGLLLALASKHGKDQAHELIILGWNKLIGSPFLHPHVPRVAPIVTRIQLKYYLREMSWVWILRDATESREG